MPLRVSGPCKPCNPLCAVPQVGARLISHAGSLTNLAKYPASTVQILGAEKALFRYPGAVAVMAARSRGCDSLGVSSRPSLSDPLSTAGWGEAVRGWGLHSGVLTPSPGPWQGAEDAGEHPQVRAHLPLHLHRARCRQEQGADLALPGQQMHHCLAHRLLLRWVWGHRRGRCGHCHLRGTGRALREDSGPLCHDGNIFRQQHLTLCEW